MSFIKSLSVQGQTPEGLLVVEVTRLDRHRDMIPFWTIEDKEERLVPGQMVYQERTTKEIMTAEEYKNLLAIFETQR